MGVPTSWGARPDEVARTYPCDDVLPGSPVRWFRAVDADAPAPAVYRWLCQLRLAPYSYDLVDNGGRRSPRTRDPHCEDLAVGQRFMQIFVLDSFVPGRDLTVRIDDPRALRVFGEVVVTYQVEDEPGGRSRLVAALRGADGGQRWRRWTRPVLAWGDLVMMRKQLLTLAALAEEEARPAAG
ncbi:SRPBCC family protein [Cellulomonas sp. URHB0016]